MAAINHTKNIAKSTATKKIKAEKWRKEEETGIQSPTQCIPQVIDFPIQLVQIEIGAVSSLFPVMLVRVLRLYRINSSLECGAWGKELDN